MTSTVILTGIIMDMDIPVHDIANMHAFSRYMCSLSLSFTWCLARSDDHDVNVIIYEKEDQEIVDNW